MKDYFLKYYKAAASGITGILGIWVATQPTMFPNLPFMRKLAIFIVAGGFASLGFTMPKKNGNGSK